MADMNPIKSYEDFVKHWDDTLELMRKSGLDNGFYRIGDFITNDGVAGYLLPGMYEKAKKGEYHNDQD